MNFKRASLLCFYRKQRKRSDGSKGSGDKTGLKSESDTLIDLLLPASPHDHHYDQESITTVEPQSEPDDFDDQRSESILSSVGQVHELEERGSDAKRIPVVEVTTPAEETDDDDDVPKSTVACNKTGIFF